MSEKVIRQNKQIFYSDKMQASKQAIQACVKL